MTSTAIRIIGLVLLALAIAACQSDEQKRAEYMKRGNEYLESKDFKEAIIEYKNVLQMNPNDGEAHYQLAKAYLGDENVREGFWQLRETVRLDPDNVQAKVDLAPMLFLAKEYDEAMAQVDAALALDPKNSQALLFKGHFLDNQGHPEEALEAFEKAVELAPDRAEPLLIYASALGRRGDREKAEVWFKKAIEVAPNFTTYATYANFLGRGEDESRDGDVVALLRKGIEVAEPDEVPRAYTALARFLFRRDRIDDAIATLEEGVEKSEDKLDLIYTLARFYSAQGDQKKAEELIEQATTAQPDQARPYLILSAYRDRKGDLEGALAAARKAVEVEPEDEDARLREAEVVIELGVKAKNDDQIAEGRALMVPRPRCASL